MKGSANDAALALEGTKIISNSSYGLMKTLIAVLVLMEGTWHTDLAVWQVQALKNSTSEDYSSGVWDTSITTKIKKPIGKKDKLSKTFAT